MFHSIIPLFLFSLFNSKDLSRTHLSIILKNTQPSLVFLFEKTSKLFGYNISSVVITTTLHFALLIATFHLLRSNKKSVSLIISLGSKNPKHAITMSDS